MATKGLGALTLDLICRLAGWTRPLDQAERQMDKATRKIISDSKKLNKGVNDAFNGFRKNVLGFTTGLVAGFVSVTGAIAGIKNAIDQADKLNDFNQRLGISAEALSGWGYAATQAGTDIDALGIGLKKLAKNMAEALDPKSEQAGIFKALGVGVKDAQGNLRDLEQVLPEIASAFKALNNETLEAALAQQIFGKSGTDLIEFLNLGSDGLDTMRERARELGIELDQNTLQAADAFNDQLADLRAASQGFFTQLSAELLPTLTKLTAQLTDLVRDGTAAADTAKSIGYAFDFLGAQLARLDGFGKIIEGMTSRLVELFAAGSAVRRLDFSTIGNLIRSSDSGDLIGQGFSQLVTGVRVPPKSAPTPKPAVIGKDFQNVLSGDAAARASKSAEIERRLNAFLSDPNGPDKPKKTGKSDAERQAEQLAKALNKMTDAQREWQTELDGTGNSVADAYAKRLAEITEKSEDFKRVGIPSEKIEEFKKKMQELALAIKDKEALEFVKEFGFQTQEMIAGANGASTAALQYAQAMDELNKTLKSGVIGQEEFTERARALEEVRNATAKSMLRDLEHEASLLGKTREQQELLTAARYLGADAATEQGQAALKALEKQQEAAKQVNEQIDQMDALRDSTRGFLDDLKEGVSIWDALDNALKKYADRLFDLAADKLIDQLFGKAGTTQTGSLGGVFSSASASGGASGGGFWNSVLSAIGSLFGGGRAAGGPVSGGSFYRVNENGPELLTVGGSDYLMMGAASGRVRPTTAGGNTYNFVLPSMVTRQTQQQVAQSASQGQRRASQRNGP